MGLTPRARVLAQINHEETDYVPYTLRFDGDVAELLDEYYGGPAWRGYLDDSIRRLPGPPLEVARTDTSEFVDPYGSLWRVDQRAFHLVEPALKSPTLSGYTLPSVDDILRPGWEQPALEAIAQHRDYFLVIGFGIGVFDRAWGLRAPSATATRRSLAWIR